MDGWDWMDGWMDGWMKRWMDGEENEPNNISMTNSLISGRDDG